jgi:hypothetical protein
MSIHFLTYIRGVTCDIPSAVSCCLCRIDIQYLYHNRTVVGLDL